MKAIRVHQLGGPEALSYEEVPEPQPGQDEAVVQVEAIGLNFIDIYYREGLYPGTLPFTPGSLFLCPGRSILGRPPTT